MNVRWGRVATWTLAAPLGLAPWLLFKELGNWDKGELVGVALFLGLLALWVLVLLRPPQREDVHE